MQLIRKEPGQLIERVLQGLVREAAELTPPPERLQAEAARGVHAPVGPAIKNSVPICASPSTMSGGPRLSRRVVNGFSQTPTPPDLA